MQSRPSTVGRVENSHSFYPFGACRMRSPGRASRLELHRDFHRALAERRRTATLQGFGADVHRTRVRVLGSKETRKRRELDTKEGGFETRPYGRSTEDQSSLRDFSNFHGGPGTSLRRRRRRELRAGLITVAPTALRGSGGFPLGFARTSEIRPSTPYVMSRISDRGEWTKLRQEIVPGVAVLRPYRIDLRRVG